VDRVLRGIEHATALWCGNQAGLRHARSERYRLAASVAAFDGEAQRIRHTATRRRIEDRDGSGARVGQISSRNVGAEARTAVEGRGPVNAVPAHTRAVD